MGYSIAKNTKIKFGTLILSKQIEIEKNVKIGPFSIIRCNHLKIGQSSVVKPLSFISTRIVKIYGFTQISPMSVISSEFTENSIFELGDHSRIFPFCWLDTGEGIKIGKNVGIGGHTLIFTHGVWSNYLQGGPVSYGPVVIKDNVWIPWRVFILPNVTISENTIVAANSLINKSFSGNSLIGGNPAKIIKENFTPILNIEDKKMRLNEILLKYKEYLDFKFDIDSNNKNELFSIHKIQINPQFLTDQIKVYISIGENISSDKRSELNLKGIVYIDLDRNDVYFPETSKKDKFTNLLISYLRRYGIRLTIH